MSPALIGKIDLPTAFIFYEDGLFCVVNAHWRYSLVWPFFPLIIILPNDVKVNWTKIDAIGPLLYTTA